VVLAGVHVARGATISPSSRPRAGIILIIYRYFDREGFVIAPRLAHAHIFGVQVVRLWSLQREIIQTTQFACPGCKLPGPSRLSKELVTGPSIQIGEIWQMKSLLSKCRHSSEDITPVTGSNSRKCPSLLTPYPEIHKRPCLKKLN
jgi:hypothetical protein